MAAPDHLYNQTALVLQGGGALGSYQAGAYESLDQGGIRPDWFAGISIGAINAAIMAGNPPDKRCAQLKAFWQEITNPFTDFFFGEMIPALNHAAFSSLLGVTYGVPGFFKPVTPTNWMLGAGMPSILSYYDTAPLRETLLRYIDFDLINKKKVRLSLGAVNVRTGNFMYFDNSECEIKPEHIMASGALPPGFPPVEIDGEFYWDGGLVSNTPLAYVLDHSTVDNTLIFQVDLFSARGELPTSLDTVEERRKDIVYSSRTRMNTNDFQELHTLRQAISKLSDHLPAAKKTSSELAPLVALGQERNVAIVHLIYRPANYEGPTKDYQFSRRSMLQHWQAGLDDAACTLKDTTWHTPPTDTLGIALYDCTQGS